MKYDKTKNKKCLTGVFSSGWKKVFFLFSALVLTPHLWAQTPAATPAAPVTTPVTPAPTDKFGATANPVTQPVTTTPPAAVTDTQAVAPAATATTEPATATPPATTESVATVPQTAAATDTTAEATPPGDELVYLNATDVDIKEMIKQISKATGTNFLLDDKLRGKITIISERPMTKEMAYQAFLSALQVMGYTTVKTPSGLVKLVATKDSISEPIDIYKDSSPNTDQFITRIIQVKNISANDISTVIKSLVSKEGNLFAYPQTNSVILTDTGANIDRIMRIIRELDQEGPQEVIEIIPIYNANASDIAQKVLDLFEDEKKDANKGRPTRRTGGAELDEAPTISKVITDERTNSVIVLGSKRAIIKMKALIARLDSPIKGVEGTIHVYYLKYATAKDIATVLSSLVTGASTQADAKGKKGGADAKSGSVQLEGGVKVTADEGTNSLIFTASPKDFQTLIDQVVSKLDIPRRQVYLEAIVMELSVNKHKEMTIGGNLGLLNTLTKGDQLVGFGAMPPIDMISTIVGASGGLAGGVISTRTIEVPVAGGSTVEVPAASAIIQALQQDIDTNILSTPSILTLDNQEAKIQVGENVGIKSGESQTSGVALTQFQRQDVGIILTITPQISESATVRLKMKQEVSNVVPGTVNDPAGATITKRQVETVVVANDKQTVVIGGLIDDQATVSTSKTPYLGDLPVLGNLFRSRTQNKSKRNILVFITPYVIRDRDDYMAILQKKMEERNVFIDLNYGLGQRKLIRESIKNHTSALLSYKATMEKIAPDVQNTYSPPAPAQLVQPKSEVKSGVKKTSEATRSTSVAQNPDSAFWSQIQKNPPKVRDNNDTIKVVAIKDGEGHLRLVPGTQEGRSQKAGTSASTEFADKNPPITPQKQADTGIKKVEDFSNYGSAARRVIRRDAN